MRCSKSGYTFRRFFLAFTASTLVSAPAVWASHDVTLFELEGNAVRGGAPGDDWTSLFPRDLASGDIARVFVRDGVGNPQDQSYFTGGGSKDTNNVTEWAWTSGDVAPDKDEIADAFAVAYNSPRDTGRTNAGDLMLYFGTDRFANNGDAQIGFWFFRNSVGLKAGGEFSGTHTVGDILVLSDFTQGGRVGNVRIYKWVGSGGSDGALDLISSGVDCNDASADDAACSVENGFPVPAPWSYAPKSGPAGTFPRGTFYEGGMNVTRLAGVRCFKTYMVETRSSQAIGAQLKDTVLGPFNTCPQPVAKPSPRKRKAAPAAAAPRPEIPATGVSWIAARIAAALLILGSGMRRYGSGGTATRTPTRRGRRPSG